MNDQKPGRLKKFGAEILLAILEMAAIAISMDQGSLETNIYEAENLYMESVNAEVKSDILLYGEKLEFDEGECDMNNIVVEWYEDKKNVDEMQNWNLALKEWEQSVIKFFPSGARILDIGCGLGREAFALSDLGYDVVGIDISKEVRSSSPLSPETVTATSSMATSVMPRITCNGATADAVTSETSKAFISYWQTSISQPSEA